MTLSHFTSLYLSLFLNSVVHQAPSFPSSAFILFLLFQPHIPHIPLAKVERSLCPVRTSGVLSTPYKIRTLLVPAKTHNKLNQPQTNAIFYFFPLPLLIHLAAPRFYFVLPHPTTATTIITIYTIIDLLLPPTSASAITPSSSSSYSTLSYYVPHHLTCVHYHNYTAPTPYY